MSGTITRTVAAMLAALALCAAQPVFAGTAPININTASAAELATLKGIGPAKAQAIVEHRDKNGQFKTVDDLAPGGSAQALLDAARWPDAREPVLVVGHQPALGMTAGILMSEGTGGQLRPWTIRKGGVIWLRGRERDGTLQVVLHVALTPEMV